MIIREATPEDAEGIATVHVDTWQTTYRGIISDKVVYNLSYKDRQQMWDDALTTYGSKNYIYVAEAANGGIVGFVAAGQEREGSPGGFGEIYAIYLLAEHQGKGWGRQLFLAAVERLTQEGYPSLMLWVLADNPTRGFYEALGGTAAREQAIEIGGETLLEIAYEWKQIEDLLP